MTETTLDVADTGSQGLSPLLQAAMFEVGMGADGHSGGGQRTCTGLTPSLSGHLDV
jgi:hypothetical protein